MKTLQFKTLLVATAIAFFGCSKDDDNPEKGGDGPPDPKAIVSIPDANFKNALLNYNPAIDTNGDGEIQVGEAEAVTTLWVTNENINNLKGIESFINLDELHCDNNTNLDNLDVSKITNLKKLIANFTALSSVDLTKNTKLTTFDCYACINLHTIQVATGVGENKIESLNICETQIAALNTQNYALLKYLIFRNTKLTALDLSSNTLLEQLFGNENVLLTKVNLKNGNIAQISDMQVFDSPNLTSICVDSIEAANAKDPDRWTKDATAVYTENCN